MGECGTRLLAVGHPPLELRGLATDAFPRKCFPTRLSNAHIVAQEASAGTGIVECGVVMREFDAGNLAAGGEPA